MLKCRETWVASIDSRCVALNCNTYLHRAADRGNYSSLVTLAFWVGGNFDKSLLIYVVSDLTQSSPVKFMGSLFCSKRARKPNKSTIKLVHMDLAAFWKLLKSCDSFEWRTDPNLSHYSLIVFPFQRSQTSFIDTMFDFIDIIVLQMNSLNMWNGEWNSLIPK